MVCSRCIIVVEKALKSFGALVNSINLGYANILVPDDVSLKSIDEELQQYGFDLIADQESATVEQIKLAVINYVEQLQKGKTILTLGEFVSKNVGKNSSHLSRVFSRHYGNTMEKYFISLRLEKVKEMLDYDELNFSQIAMTMGYSSVHYLSNQFKKVTGQTMSDYKHLHQNKRVPIDRL